MKRFSYFSIIICLFFSSIAFAQDDWTQILPASKPSARYWHAMAYIEPNKAILFGGLTVFEDWWNSTKNDETWLFDLSTNQWSPKFPSSKPSGRNQHAIAYITSDIVLLFGGWSTNNETWIYDLSDNTWLQKSPTTSPSGRYQHGMANIGGDKVLLFGGNNSAISKDDTWIYDLSDNNWTQKSPSTSPAVRDHHGMANIGGDQVLLFGGYNHGTSGLYGDTWLYDLSDNSWTEKSPSTEPSDRYSQGMAYIGGDQVLLFGGWDESTYFNETWIYDLSDNTWSQDANSTQPSGRRQLKLSETSMDGSSYPVLFGGNYESSLLDDTWTFGGGDYSLPVELSSFTAISDKEQIVLNWVTESEVDNSHFILKRGLNENNLVFLAEIQGKGNSTTRCEYSFIDENIDLTTTYYYQLNSVDISGKIEQHETINITYLKKVVPEKYSIANYPNPFNPQTTIAFDLPEKDFVTIDILDLQGRLIKRLSDNSYEAGNHLISWNGNNQDGNKVSSGVYIFTIRAGKFTESKKMLKIQ